MFCWPDLTHRRLGVIMGKRLQARGGDAPILDISHLMSIWLSDAGTLMTVIAYGCCTEDLDAEWLRKHNTNQEWSGHHSGDLTVLIQGDSAGHISLLIIENSTRRK